MRDQAAQQQAVAGHAACQGEGHTTVDDLGNALGFHRSPYRYGRPLRIRVPQRLGRSHLSTIIGAECDI